MTEVGADLTERAPLLDAFVISPEVGWVVNRAGLYQTKNGGKGWTRIAVPQLDDGEGRIHAVYFLNDKKGWIAGGKYQKPLKGESLPNNALSDDRKRILVGCVFETTDAGANWRQMHVQRSIGRFNKIMFAGSFGITTGDAGMQIISNAEDRWTKALSEFRNKDTGEMAEVLSGFLLDDRRAWLSLSGAKLIGTTDSGKSWTLVYPPHELQRESEAVVLNNLVFVDDQRGLALGRELGSGKLYKTNNGGRTWTQILSELNFTGLGPIAGTELVVAVGDNSIYSLSVKSYK